MPPVTQLTPGALAPEVSAVLAAAPGAAAFVELAAAGEAGIRFIAANATAIALFRLGAVNAEAIDPDTLLGCLHDSREPSFRNRVRACVAGEEAAPLKVLAQRPGSAAPFGGARFSAVLLEARFARLAGGALVFFEEAHAQGPIGLPEGAEGARMQRAIFEISRAAHDAPTLDALFERIHGIVERLIGAKNFYIALVDEPEQMLRFVYSKDEFDVRTARRLGFGVTELVYYSGQPLLIDRAKATRMLQEGVVVNHGVPAQVWLGVPLIVTGRPVGVMAVQDYHNPDLLGEPERQLLTYISDQIANAIAVKRAEDAAAWARTEAERAGRVKSDFLAVMSHELRSPLTAVIGFSDLMQESLAGRPEAKQAASIGQAGHRLLNAVNQMLDYARVDALAQPVHEETVDLEELLLVCQGFFSARIREKNLTYAVRREGFVPDCLRSDGQILKQILIHLIANAVKFTATGGRIRVFVRAEPAAPFGANRHRFELTVEDNGIGVSPEMQARLFRPFEQAGRPGHGQQGTGLGLAISQRLAALLGGKITVQSRPGEGSAFTLGFTATAATRCGRQVEGPDAAAQRELLLRSHVAHADWRVLVVDGDADSRTILAGLVESVSGLRPLVAATPEEARLVTGDRCPDVAFVDVPSVESDALLLSTELRVSGAGAGRRPVIIASSVDHAPALVQRCVAAGANNYVPKPLSRRAVLEALLSAVQTRQ